MCRSFAPSLLVVLLLPAALLTGCAESFTTSRQSHEQGMQLYRQQNYGDAAGVFRDAVKQEPRDYQSQFYLGVCYDQLQQHQLAFNQYRKTLEIMAAGLEGRHDEAFRQVVLDTYAVAVARYDEHEVELAELERRAAADATVDDLFLLAKTYRLRGDVDLALKYYRMAAEADKWNFHVRKELGLYLLDPLRLRDEAGYYLQQANRLDPSDVAVNNGLAQLGITPPPSYLAADPPVAPPAAVPAGPVRATGGSTVHLPRD
jgi:Tfp pilus assembly protein PilF